MGGGGGGLFSGTKGGCFVAGTLILTESGWKVIEEIKTGDFVFSKNVETGETGFKRVVETFVHMANQFVCLSLGQTLIEATLEHPFWIHQKGWKEAQFLLSSDFLADKDNLPVSIQNVERKIIAKEKPVYNFHVEDFCTYFISQYSILVHNNSSQKIGTISEKVIKNLKKKWGEKAIQAFEKARQKGFVAPKGTNGIKKLKGDGIKKGEQLYKYEIKVKNKEYGDFRIYGREDKDGQIIFDYFDKGLH